MFSYAVEAGVSSRRRGHSAGDAYHVLKGHVHVADVADGRATISVRVLLADLVDETTARRVSTWKTHSHAKEVKTHLQRRMPESRSL